MLHRTLSLLIAVVALSGLVAPLSPERVVAQEGSPVAGPELPPGVTAEFIGGAPLAELPANPGLVVLVRLTLEPGPYCHPNRTTRLEPSSSSSPAPSPPSQQVRSR